MSIELVKGKQHLVIKRDGRVEPYSEEKLRKVLMWATDNNEIMVEEILKDIDLKIYNKIHIATLFDEVIDTVANKISELYPQWDEVAKRLYLQKIYKETWGVKRNEYPDYLKVIQKGIETGLYDKNVIDYFTEEELRELGDYIKQERDFNFDYLGLRVIMDKYSLKINEYTNLELPQHIFMRLAIFGFYKEPKEERLSLIKKRYDDLSNFIYTEATPKYFNSLTPNPQMASCVLTVMGDDSYSINHTLTNLGIYSKYGGGTACDVSHIRAKGSKIRKSGKSSGIIPYIKLIEGMMTAYDQLGKRMGACCVYCNWWHYEIEDFVMLKDEGGTEDNRARKLKYSIKLNRLFIDRLLNDEEITLFDPKDVPELLTTYGEEFNKWYEYYEKKEGIRKKKIKARDLAYLIAKVRMETGNLYIFFIENTNEHTPFKEYINSSNLCVTPDTKILTKEYGEIEIYKVAGQIVTIWNGEEWTKAPVFKTGEDYDKWYRVILLEEESGEKVEIITTDYHRWYVYYHTDEDILFTTEERGEYVTRTKDLLYKLQFKDGHQYEFIQFKNPSGEMKKYIVYYKERLENFVSDSYCFYEPKLNRGILNGVLTGNCSEVMLPTRPSYLKEDRLIKDYSTNKVEIHRVIDSGLIALCNLSSINVVKWMQLSEKEKEEVAYNLLRASDNLIEYAYYPSKEGEYSNKYYRPIGIGMSNLAQYFASKGIKFTDEKALEEMDRVMYNIYYHIIKASTKLAKERGVFEGYYNTKWSEGWMPYEIPELKILIQRYGVRFATHFALPPTATSSLIAGATESFEPIKEYVAVKTGTYNCLQLAPNLKKYREYYQLAWEIPNEILFKLASIRQKYIEQGQSINQYDDGSYSAYKMWQEIILAEKLGLKSLYYFVPKKAELDNCESCSS